MRRNLWPILLLLAALSAGCQIRAGEEEDNNTPLPPTPTTSEKGIFPRPTLTPPDPSNVPAASPTLEGYPPPPPPTDTPEGYPAPTVAPLIDAYPAGELAWVLRPVGEQCADADEAEYADLQEATAALAAVGVPVEAAEMTNLTVCASCGCPTRAHFRVQINRADLAGAITMGWRREE